MAIKSFNYGVARDMESFSWTADKRRQALEKHGIDFIDAATIFLGPHLILPTRSDVEQRLIAVGQLGGIVISVVFTMRGETCRIITARRARRDEREHYETLLIGRTSPDEGRN